MDVYFLFEMAFNYFRATIAVIVLVLIYTSTPNERQKRGLLLPTTVSICNRFKSNSIALGFTEGITVDSVTIAQQIKGLVNAPTAIFFHIDDPVYLQQDKGFSAYLVENGHVVGLRWTMKWSDTVKLSKLAFQEALIDKSQSVHAAINKYAVQQSTYYPKYLLFDYTLETDVNLIKYSDYAAELGFVTITSQFLPESNAKNIKELLQVYSDGFKIDNAGIGTFRLALHPGNANSILKNDNFIQLSTLLNQNAKSVVSFMDCAYGASAGSADRYRKGIF